jgi:hypothetical protein
MKSLIVLLPLALFSVSVRSQETVQFEVTLAATNNAADVVGTSTFLLTSNHLVYFASGSFPSASVNDAAGAVVFDLDGGCGIERPCGYSGELTLTQEQVAQLRLGLWSVEAGGGYRGQILPTCVTQFSETGAIQLNASLFGRNTTDTPRYTRWGRAWGWLSGSNFSFRISLPATYGPYRAVIIQNCSYPCKPGAFYYLGTLDCAPIVAPPFPDATGLEVLPQCVAQGSLCLTESQIAELLAGGMAFVVFPTDTRIIHGNAAQGGISPTDTDHDGIPDFRDACPNTPPAAVVNAGGCSIEQLAPCAGQWKNHGEYVISVKQVTSDFARAGLITEAQRRALLIQAAQSGCGGR